MVSRLILKPTAEDHRLVAFYAGKVITGVGFLMLIPMLVSLAFAEWDSLLNLAIGLLLCLTVGLTAQAAFYTRADLRRRHGFVVVSTSWIAATVLGAAPYALSGHYSRFTDCLFDVMSGFTTTGLYLLQDLDHVSNGLNMYRHLLSFVGGQGIVVLALTFLFRGAGSTFQLYAGEGKDERLVPHVVGTARIIWIIGLVWLALGTVALAGSLMWLGESPVRALLHGVWIFMGAFSTGGFAPQSYNTVWYHSLLFEVVTIIIMFAGSLNFALHWAAWTGKPRELLRNIETRSFAATFTLFVAIATYALARQGVYSDDITMFRKVFYQIMSGHTTTGFSTIYSRAFVTHWGPLAMLATVAAMAIGASACSTAGGIKGLRIGITTKTFLLSIKEMVSPDSAAVVARYHHIRDTVLTDAAARSALTITTAFLTMYGLITILGVMAGYPLAEAAFEGVSAASNTGLSCGVAAPGMPQGLELAYVLAMWLGRMEFLAVFAFVGWMWAVVRGR